MSGVSFTHQVNSLLPGNYSFKGIGSYSFYFSIYFKKQQHEPDKKLLFFFSVVGGDVLCGNDHVFHVCHCAAPLCLLLVPASMYKINVNKYLTKLLELLREKSIHFFTFFLSGRHLATGQMLLQLIFLTLLTPQWRIVLYKDTLCLCMRFPARHKPLVLEPDCHKEALSSRQGPADFLPRIETFKFTCPMGNYLAHYTLYTLLLCCSDGCDGSFRYNWNIYRS